MGLERKTQFTAGGIGTPKSGKSRRVAMTESLSELLFDLLGQRRQECLNRGWPQVPEWV
jgi:hypothetical protein